MTNDIMGLAPNSMTFQSSAYVLNGNLISIDGNISTGANQPTINTDLTLLVNAQLQTAIYNGDIDLNSHNLTFVTGDPRTEVHGVISGSGNITVQGGYLTNLYGTNTFTGSITIESSAALNALNSAALGNSANSVLVKTNGYISLDGGINIPNNITFEASAGVGNYSTGNTLSGNLTGPASEVAYFFPSGTDTLTLSGTITADFIALGSNGHLIISGSSSNDLDTILVQSGKVTLSKTGSAVAVNDNIVVGQGVGGDTIILTQTGDNQIGNSATITVNSDGFWGLNNRDEQVGTVYVNNGEVDTENGDLTAETITMSGGEIDSGTGAITLNGNISVATDTLSFAYIRGARLNLNATNTSMTIADGDLAALAIESLIYGTGDISIYGALVAFAGDNSNFSGDIFVGDSDTPGILGIKTSNSALGDSIGKTVIANGSSLSMDGISGEVDESIEVSGNGIGEISGQDLGAIHAVNGVENQLNGSITLLEDTRITTGEGGALSIFGVISGNYDMNIDGINDEGTGVLFAGTNTFIGTTTVNDNTLYLSNNNALNDNQPVTLNANGVLMVTETEQIGPLTGSGRVDITDDQILIMVYSGSGTKTFSGVISGAGDIIKYGADNWVITGNSPDFTGILYNSEGPITVNGDISNSQNHAQGGTWAGTGTLGYTHIASGYLSPGNSPGILHIDTGLNLTYLAHVVIQINGSTVGSGYDQADVTGDVTIGNSILDVTAASTPSDGTEYTILKASGTITGTFAGLPNLSAVTVGGKQMYIEYSAHAIKLILPAELLLTKFTATPSTTTYGKSVTLDVTWGGTGATPTGTTSFMEGSTTLGTKTLAAGKASLTLTNLAVGTHSIHVVYSGDGTYNPAISNPITVTINKAPSGTGNNETDNSEQIDDSEAEPDSEPASGETSTYKLLVIVNDEEGKPVNNALVTIQPGNLSGRTNKLGRLEFLELESGDYKIKIEYNGKKIEKNISVTKDDSVIIKLTDTRNSNKNSNILPIAIATITLLVLSAGGYIWIKNRNWINQQ